MPSLARQPQGCGVCVCVYVCEGGVREGVEPQRCGAHSHTAHVQKVSDCEDDCGVCCTRSALLRPSAARRVCVCV
jgi:hypothetical protein